MQAALRTAQRGKTHRPTAAIVFEDRSIGWESRPRRFLVIWSKNDGTGENPGIVKGGVEGEELVMEAVLREAEEEVGIKREHVVLRYYLGARSVKSYKRKGDRDKKLYLIVYAHYTGPLALTVNPNELSRYAWLTLDEIEHELDGLHSLRPDKERVLREIFAAIRRRMEAEERKKEKLGENKPTHKK
jgi:8-oxo-dGTP pyrophosphatase MutT (NUDIX family)